MGLIDGEGRVDQYICVNCGPIMPLVIRKKFLVFVDHCYVRFVNKRWVKGCAYDRIENPEYKDYWDKKINTGEQKNV